MKEQTMSYATITVAEYWNPSVQIRFVKRKEVNILQQLFTSNLGNSQWKDVPVETEN